METQTEESRKSTSSQHLRISMSQPFLKAIARLGDRCGLTPKGFIEQLLEVTLVTEYERRFSEPIGRLALTVEMPGAATACHEDHA